ncbi:MAG TPA: sugar phosphate isomerase/epimerase [Candidatus Hydrogenedentes bacterium]|nr:sugar phosphate isomerase/epimerase [Candidatus Hydrogenedentota bacterium]
MQPYPFALQLYSVRDYCEKNPEDGLRRVKAAGYDHVELAGLYGLDAMALKRLLDTAGLTPISMHAGFELIAADLREVIQQAKTLNVAYVVVPWLGGEACPDKKHWLMAVERMNAAGATLADAGVQLCYHNHAHEFQRFDDETIFDIIFSNSAPANLKIELDTCWSTIGGADTVALLEQYAGRIPLVHIKDCKPVDSAKPLVFTELGCGIMDWTKVLPAAKAAGAEWFIVEQDESEGDTIKSAAVSAAFMKAQNDLGAQG